jgi:DNA repair protein RadC
MSQKADQAKGAYRIPGRNSGSCEWKIVAVREMPAPEKMLRCDTPEAAASYWQTHIATAPNFNPEVECFAVLLLNTRHRIRGYQIVSIGSLNETVVHPREVFRAAVISAAYAIVLMHNHPSGEPEPSSADIKVTRMFVEAGKLLRIEVLDHVIVGHQRHYSFREAGHL